jgi:hypothetical protein
MSSSEMKREFVSSVFPVRSSVPVAIISARMAEGLPGFKDTAFRS